MPEFGSEADSDIGDDSQSETESEGMEAVETQDVSSTDLGDDETTGDTDDETTGDTDDETTEDTEEETTEDTEEETTEDTEEETTEDTDKRTEKQIKGDELEGKTMDEMAKIEGMVKVYDGAATHGFDSCHWHPDIGWIITDSKNLGSEDKAGYVSEVSAWKPERLVDNTTKLLDSIDANESITDDCREQFYKDLENGKGTFLVVGGENTIMSTNRQEEWGAFANLSTLAPALESLKK